MIIRIGTRKSKLAMVQTEIVKREIESRFPEAEIVIVPMSTKGDKILDRSLTSFGGKGVFTKELEEALLNGEIDMAVHSAKDMPMEFPKGLCLGAVLDRENPGDVLVTTTGIKASDLKKGSVIGTSSLRRELQIKNINPQVRIKMLRGNVQTRLEKLKQGEYDGILLAAAGLKRLGMEEPEGFYLEYLDKEQFVPAPGQGILAVEIREGELASIMEGIHCREAAVMLKAEREYLTILGGSCNAPCGAYCRQEGEGLVMTAMYAKDGVHPVYKRMKAEGQTEEDGRNLAKLLASQVSYKTVSLVGAGPGDKGLLSRKGLECVRNADVIVYDNLISPSILNEARLDAKLIYAGKRSSHHHLTQDKINEVLVEEASAGNYVVRLKGGDPYIFGRGGEEALELKKHGIPFEIVPGVSSSYSVPAYGGIPVTQRNMASSFHVITGHEGNHKDAEVLNYATLAKEEGTLIFLMGLHNLERITKQLMENGKDPSTPAAVISAGTTGRQKKASATLETIVRAVKEQEIPTPAITVIGQVASLGEELEWFLKGRLSGVRILLTGTRHMVKQLEEELDPLGAETISLSLVETKELVTEEALNTLHRLDEYKWIVFTSNNGVNIFFDLLRREKIDYRALMHLKFAAVGKSSAAALAAHGFICDFQPSSFSGAGLAKEWIPGLDRQDKVVLVRAKEASPVLPEALNAAGIPFEDLTLYETWADERRKEELNRIVKDVDYITIASGSAARALKNMLEEPKMLEAGIISIGPATTKEAEKAGLAVCAEADEYTAAGIAAAILDRV
ncbi:hydroxymethylbilane synthase [Clostridium sp. MCC353]|uniref:hydroxymethylbilane synthase n=1 Tax=Clostridium sp. MCC353 TaxID=2592646 RepID=UPI001C017650|nr:hydroxymethylbilane synthase [Clostridium sp. MCC353]MBT9775271.1 hydroxymethylbilane synthase [Clostridium sp. MCC353]